MKIVKKYPDGVFSWVDLTSTDIAGAHRFYSGLFGWEVDEQPIGDSGGYYTQFRIDGHTVAGGGQMQPEMRESGAPSVWVSYVNVEDIDAAAARAAEAGGVVFMGPMDVLEQGRLALVQDPTGAVVGMWQAGRHTGAQVVNRPNAWVWNELQTHDKARAKEFYRHVFGWEDQEDESGYVAWLRDGRLHCGGMAIEESWGDVPSNWAVYFLTEDVEATAARVAELGGRVVVGPGQAGELGRFFVAQDPQGAYFSVIRYDVPVDAPPGETSDQ
jgi:predicted enzyme related to lactoylglutathione lyase